MDEQQNQRNIKEIYEAIDAANLALSYLYKAEDLLRSASNWGLFDMFGGGLIASFVKHNKMSQARQHMEQAKWALDNFNKEVRDVNQSMSLGMETMDFMGMTDIFLDNFLIDWMVQGQINENIQQVDQAINMVLAMKNRLESML